MKPAYLFFTLFIICHADIFSQDNHYWTQQFGARASARGGAFVAGADKNTAVYYNPAALCLINQSSLCVNATLYKTQRTFIKKGIGDNINLRSMSYNYYPQGISGMPESKKKNIP